MIESFISFSVLGGLPAWQHYYELVGYTYGVEHLVFCISWMYIASFECHFGYCGVEVLIFELADSSAIHSVCPVGTKELNIKFMCSKSDFFVRIERYTDVPVLDFRMGFQVVYSSNDLCNACLVVSTEKGVSIGYDQIFTFVVEQFRELSGREDNIFGRIKCYVTTVVALDYSWSDVATAHVRRGIQMCDKAYCRYFFVNISG